jgi:hypothetical protein|tara:strand:+ start:6268 stop:6708 length:441 start_codon:yes stop_codon:yes gene_type:complete
MIYIAHRGNIDKKNVELENNPDYIKNALRKGFDAEIDVWHRNKLYLGHDEPQHECSLDFLQKHSSRLWIHCKNLEALENLIKFKFLNVFWHENDDFTLTSKGYIWTYPGKSLTKNSIAVMPEIKKFQNLESCFGICSDFISTYLKN